MDVARLTSDEVNREIAKRRGADSRYDVGNGLVWDLSPDYLEWQHCGPLLEELATRELDVAITWQWDRCEVLLVGRHIMEAGEQLRDAIRRAWLAWKVGEDELR